MKKTVGLLSLLLALLTGCNTLTPLLSDTIRNVMTTAQVASVQQTVGDNAGSGADDASSSDKKAAYANGKIQIYTYAQLSAIGSGKSFTYDDGVTAKYAPDAAYQIAADIPLPRHTQWQLPDGFKGTVTGTRQEKAPLYENAGDSIFLYNPYQLAVTAMDNAAQQTVLSGDADAKTFGSGKPVPVDEDCKVLLTYSDDHNYVVSTQFSSQVPEKPVSVRADKQVEAVGAKADGAVGAPAAYDGRDFAGQVIKKIGDKTYILIGNDAQLRAIGSGQKVWTPVYRIQGGNPTTLLYGGDADLTQAQNGSGNFTFHQINSGYGRAGVNQETGEVYTDSLHVDATALGTAHSWETNATYTINANYIIFRDIDLGGSANPWTPLMFTGNMYGVKSINNEKLWNGSAVGDATALNARTTDNRPVISNVYVNNNSPIEVDKYMGIGFFATVTNEINTADIGVSGGTVHVENLELSQVEVHNTATTAKSTQTILSGLTSGLGWLVGGLVDLLTTALSFGSMQLSLRDTLSHLLNARAQDPTIFATGAFAGRVIGDVDIFNCAVTGSVTVENVKDYTGGFIGYSEGVTEYSGLSQTLDITVDALSSVLNAIPAVGLGDLITILLDNALPVGQLIPTGYYNPQIRNCTVDGLSGQIGHSANNAADTDFNGGFIGCQIGVHITDSKVTNSNYTVAAKNYGGGFAGLERDAIIKGTLDGVGVDLSSLMDNIHPQSELINCVIKDSTYQVTGENCLGGFVGAMTSSYAVDCTIDCPQNPVSVHGTGDYVGGFAGYSTVGWQSNLGENENDEKSLLGTVRQLLTGALSENPSAQQQLLSLMGVSPSALLGCQIYSSQLEVEADGSFAGGIVGKGDGIYLVKSNQAAYDALADWNADVLKETPENKPIILSGLKSVRAHENYAGGVAGYLGSADYQGLLNATVGLGRFINFNAGDITVTGVEGGYTVKADNYDAGGGFGTAIGGTITNVKLNRLQRVEAFNRAAGFVGIAGPGELAGTGGLTVNLLGLDRLLTVNNLLNIGEGVEVKINDCDVTGIDSGYTVEATGANTAGSENIFDFTAAGFIADSNSTKIIDSHCYKLLSVTATDTNGFAGGFIGTSQTGGLAEAANNDATQVKSLLQANGLIRAIEYLIPTYTNCTTNFMDGGLVDADIAGGFVADFESGTVDNTTIASVDDAQNPKWTHTMKELYDPDAVNPTDDLDKQFAVINIDQVHGRTYGGGFGGKLRSGALANAGGGVSVLGSTGLNINISSLLDVMSAYVPTVKNAGVYSANGFTVVADVIRAGDPDSGSAGGFGGYMSGAQVSNCDVYTLKHTNVTPPDDLEAADGSSYFGNQSAYAVKGGHFAGGYVGIANIGDAASIGHGLGVLGDALDLTNVASALSVVITTIEHSDVQGAAGGFSVIADGTDSNGTVGKSGGFAGEIDGAHIQNSHCKNFYYIIGQEAAGGYVGNMKPGDAAKLLDNASVISTLVNVNGSLLSLVNDFVPTIRNSTTSCVPCGGAVRAQAASDSGFQRGCAGGYCGHNEGGHIWGLDTHTWQDQNDGVVAERYFGHDREGEYTGEQHIAAAWRIRSVYGHEYAGGFTGFMEAADTAGTGNISLLSGLVKVDNLLTALSVVYPTETNTAVYGPLQNLDAATWSAWVTYVGKFGGYGMELASLDSADIAAAQAPKYYYGCNVVAGRSTAWDTVGNETVWPITEGADAGGYVGLMRSGVITNGQSYDMKEIRAIRSAGGYAGSMQTGGIAELGQAGVSLFGLDLSANLGKLVQALGDVFVPVIKSGSVRGWQSGLMVIGSGLDRDNNNDQYFDNNNDVSQRCGYAGGYVGSAYGAQIWGDQNVGNTAGTGCNVSNLRYVRGNNAAGGYAGIATAASLAEVNTHASKSGVLQGILDTVINHDGDLASVLQATVTKIKQAQVDPDNATFGFIVEGANSTPPRYAGGFAGVLEAAFVGVDIGDVTDTPAANTAIESNIAVNGLRSVNGIYYAGGFFGLADVTGVAKVSGNSDSDVLGSTLSVGEVNALDAFRSYVYYSEVNGVDEGIIVRAHGENSEAMLGETRVSGCAGGFGGAMMNGTAKYSKVTNLNTVYGKNYTGGFIGHMGKSGVVNANDANVADLVGLTAGVFDVFSTHTDGCYVYGIPAGAVVMATGGTEPIAGGFVGYADVSKIKNCHVESLKQVYSDQIAGGFVGKTDMHYLISVEANSPLVTAVEGILDLVLKALLVNELEQIDLLDLNIGIAQLDLLQDGDLLYVNLLGLPIGVSLVKDSEGNPTDTALVNIGDSYIELPYNNDGFIYDNNKTAAVINLIKGNRTRIEDSSVKGIDIGYDVYGGGAGNDQDGSHENGKTGGFVGFNNEGHLLNNSMEYCDVVRGTVRLTGPFSGNTSLQSVYSFNTLASIEGENNTYSVYRMSGRTYAMTSNNTQIGGQAVTDNDYKRFTVTHLAAPITPGTNEAYYLIFEKWKNAKIAANAGGADSKPIAVYANNGAKAVLMLDTPTEPNVKSLVPNPGESKDPCEETMKLTVQKIWKDHDNSFGARPASIRVRILQHQFDQMDANGHPVTDSSAETVVPYTDTTVIPDVDANGWFTITVDNERADSSTWTRVIDGLPVYTSDPDTYYTYTVEEEPVPGYTTEITYDETDPTAVATTATIVNSKKLEIQFKYYDRYEIDGKPAGISSEPTTYTVSVDAIPKEYLTLDANTHFVSSINFDGLIGAKATEFSESEFGVNNVMCDYDLWTNQRAAVIGITFKHYFVNGVETAYPDGTIYHTNYLGQPQSSGERWVSYYDTEGNELLETDKLNVYETFEDDADYVRVSKIVVWCYNYPKQYNVDIYGANSEDDLNPIVIAGNQQAYIATPLSADEDVKWLNGKFYYNQRFGEATGNANQDDEGFIKNYGIPGYSNVKPADYAAESFDDYTFAYWAYDEEGTQIASVERDFKYRVTTDTKLYAVYTNASIAPGISISANTNDTFVDSSGVSRTRLNILGSVYGAADYDPKVEKLSFVNISLSSQIRSHPEIYTPQKVNALFEQYKDQLKQLIQDHDDTNGSKAFNSNVTYQGGVDEETGNVVETLNLTLTTKGYVYTVVSNGNTPAPGDETIQLSNKNRVQFTIDYKTSALNINNTNPNGNTCLMYCGAVKYDGAWSVSTNCLLYYNGEVIKNTAAKWE